MGLFYGHFFAHSIKSCNDFMKRVYAAPCGKRFIRLRRTKIPICAASYGVVRNYCHSPSGCGTGLSLLKGSYILFEFIPRCPESRDLHYVPTSSGEFKYKKRRFT